MSNFWKSLNIILNIFGTVSLVFFVILVINMPYYLGTPYWILGAGITWLMFLTTLALFTIATNLRWLPTPTKLENKAIKEALQENK